MASKNLSFVLTGTDQSASATLAAVGLKGANTADKVSGAFSKMGGLLGGEFSELGEKIGAVFESAGNEGTKMGTKVAAAGAAISGIGAILTNMGSADKQAQDQLAQAIDNTGQSFSDYSEDIEKAISHEENFGHSAVDTQNALQKITTATGDPIKALSQMSVVTDLAAAKHESLSAAADQVDKILAGSGSKTLALYGITMGNTGDKTADAEAALAKLATKLDGQASASMNNWSSKVDIAKTKLEDWAAKVGEKLGPALTAAGPALMVAGAAMDIYSSRAARAAAAQTVLATTAEESGVAVGTSAATASSVSIAADDAAAASTLELAGALGESTGTQLTLFTAVGSGAQAASDVAIGADTAAEESTASLATAVQGSASAQLAAFGSVASGSQGMAAAVTKSTASVEAESATVGEASVLSLGPVGVALGGIALAAGAATLAYHLFSSGAKESTVNVRELTQAVQADSGAIGDNTRESVANALQKAGVLDVAQKLGVSLEDVTDASLGNTEATMRIKDAYEQFNVTQQAALQLAASGTGAQQQQAQAAVRVGGEIQKQGLEWEKLNAAVGGNNEKVNNAVGRYQQLNAATGGLSKAQTDLDTAVTNLTSAYDAQLTSLDNLQGVVLTTQEASLQFKDGLAALTAQVQSAAKSNEVGARSLDINTAAGRANAESIDALLKKAQDQATTSLKQGASVDSVTKAYAGNVAQIEAAGKAAGISKADVDKYIASLKSTPKDIETTITANVNVNIAEVTAASVNKKLQYINGLNGHAAGGVIGGQTIDEAGLEALNLPNGTTVIPHGQTQQMERGLASPAGSININLYSLTSPTHEDGRRIADALNSFLQTGNAVGRYSWLNS